MRQYQPVEIRVARYPALLEWIERFLKGFFPYTAKTRPSGFPFLFFLVFPFYLLGDLGLFQVFGFLLFSYLAWRKRSLLSPILLLASPSFLFEVLTRSELFTNMTVILAYLLFFQRKREKMKGSSLFLYGLLGGLLLATRGIVLLIYLLFFPFYFRNELKRGKIFFAGIFFGFLLINLPFFLWQPNYFFQGGPLFIQTAYIPFWLLILFFGFGLISSLKWLKGVSYWTIGLFTFFVVFLPFFGMIIREGFYATLFRTGFDISYFIFPLPFLLYDI